MVIRFDRLCVAILLVTLLCIQDTLGAAAADRGMRYRRKEIGYYNHDRCEAYLRAGQGYCYLSMSSREFPSFFHFVPVVPGGRRSGYNRSMNIPDGYKLSVEVKTDLINLFDLRTVPPAQRVAPNIAGLSPMDQAWIGPHLRADIIDFERIGDVLQDQHAIEERGRRRSQ